MKFWHSTKINRCLALKTTIGFHGWCVELFAVEVGARGYCSKSAFCCFNKVGFNNALIRNNIKKLSKSSTESSFCIWLPKNNKDLAPAANWKLDDPSKEACNSASSLSSLKQTTTNTKPVHASSVQAVDLINKGSTCYINSILKILSIVLNL